MTLIGRQQLMIQVVWLEPSSEFFLYMAHQPKIICIETRIINASHNSEVFENCSSDFDLNNFNLYSYTTNLKTYLRPRA
jgi:hypothetical protein